MCFSWSLLLDFDAALPFYGAPTASYLSTKTFNQTSRRQKNTIGSQKSQLYCTFIVIYSVERATFSMKGLFPGQKRWCEIQNHQCKHVGHPFTLVNVLVSVWVTPYVDFTADKCIRRKFASLVLYTLQWHREGLAWKQTTLLYTN